MHSWTREEDWEVSKLRICYNPLIPKFKKNVNDIVWL